MKWIKLCKFNSNDEFAIPVERILSVHKATGDGCCIVTQEERGTLNTHVAENYDWVVNELNTTAE